MIENSIRVKVAKQSHTFLSSRPLGGTDLTEWRWDPRDLRRVLIPSQVTRHVALYVSR